MNVQPSIMHARFGRICAVALCVVALAGCVGSRVAPAGAVAGIRSVAIVPIRFPIAVTPALLQAFESQPDRKGGVAPSPAAGILGGAALLYVLSVEWPRQEDIRNRAVQHLAEWAASDDRWSPEQVLAEDAAVRIRRNTPARDVRINPVSELPGVTARDWTWHGENWMQPRRAWYRRNAALIDINAMKALGADAVLEIAAGPIEASREHLYLHVSLKLIRASDNEVLGRRNCVGFAESAPLDTVFRDEGKLFKSIYAELSGRVLAECLHEAGMLP